MSKKQPCTTENSAAPTSGCAGTLNVMKSLLQSGRQLPEGSGRETAAAVAAAAAGQRGSLWDRIKASEAQKSNSHVFEQLVQCVVETSMLDFASYYHNPEMARSDPEAQPADTKKVTALLDSGDHLLQSCLNTSVKSGGKASKGKLL